MPYSMQQTQPRQPKAAQRKQHAVSKNTYCGDSVLSNEKDEPKMTKARCTHRRRCGYLQCVKYGEGGAAVAAPIKPKSKSKSKLNKIVRNVPSSIQQPQIQQPKSNTTTTTRCIQNTYRGDPVLSNEKYEPKMTKERCSLGYRSSCLQ